MRIHTQMNSCTYLGVFILFANTISAFGQVQLQPIPNRPQQPQAGNGNILKKNDSITANDVLDRVRQNCHHKEYLVDLVGKNRYVIDLVSSDFDCYLRLEDANGRQLSSDDDGGDGLNSRLTFVPPQNGKFKIITTTFGARQVGRFTLTVSMNQVAFSKQGKLSVRDPKDVIRQNCYFQIVLFKMVKGKVYTIDLEGNYDPYLRIEDALGNNRAQDDDGGVGLNSRLIFRPEETDTYRIIITSCSGGVGPYTLSISD